MLVELSAVTIIMLLSLLFAGIKGVYGISTHLLRVWYIYIAVKIGLHNVIINTIQWVAINV